MSVYREHTQGRLKWVLVVEDDDDNRELILEILGGAGYSVQGVNSGAAALTLLRTERQPCLVLADLVMNDMDGKELLVEARRILDSKVPPFLFVTGAHPSKLDDVSAAVLTKPFDLDQLLCAVAHHCGPA
jgi:two-component system cell cycle response regulator CpdR